MLNKRTDEPIRGGISEHPRTCQSIDWYAEGETRTVQLDGVQITIRFIGRKGRKGRIAIEAPAGAVFGEVDGMHPRLAH
jgi:hypothetical protein